MAFMMPVVKKNYSLYSSSPGSGGVPPEQRVRRTSDKIDGRDQKAANRGKNATGFGRRKAKSECQSLSTSPGETTGGDGGTQRTKPVVISKHHPRGSTPILVPGTLHSSSFHQSSHMPKKMEIRPSTSAPAINSPIHPNPNGSTESTRSSISSSSSSDSSKGQKFHSKLVMRLRKTFRIKDPEPSNT